MILIRHARACRGHLDSRGTAGLTDRDGRDIGERSDAVLRTAMPGHDDRWVSLAYSGTIPIQNIVLSPTSISYVRAKVSLPSSPIRKMESPAAIVLTASPSRTFTGRLCCTTIRRPPG